MRTFFSRSHPYLLWLILAAPALGMTFGVLNNSDPRFIDELIHASGEMSARLLILAMMASPLVLLLKGWRGPQWMKRNRRYLGVAEFGYGLLHTIFCLQAQVALANVIDELPRFYIWTGWLAFLIFIPLALTSMDYLVRKMGRWWKWLQRWTYGAAVLTLLHWAALHNWGGTAPALVHFGPLIALEAYRIWYWFLRPRPHRLTSV